MISAQNSDLEIEGIANRILARSEESITVDSEIYRWAILSQPGSETIDIKVTTPIPLEFDDLFRWKRWWDLGGSSINPDVSFDMVSYRFGIEWRLEIPENVDYAVTILTGIAKRIGELSLLIKRQVNPCVESLTTWRSQIHTDLTCLVGQLACQDPTSERKENEDRGRIIDAIQFGAIPNEILIKLIALINVNQLEQGWIEQVIGLIRRECALAKELIDNGNLTEDQSAPLLDLRTRQELVFRSAKADYLKESLNAATVNSIIKPDLACEAPAADAETNKLSDHGAIADPLTAKEIFELLASEIVGQDEACRILAATGHALLRGQRIGAILMKGPTGVGKSLLLDFFARILGNVRVEHVSSTSLVPEGITGTSLSDVLRSFLGTRASSRDEQENEPSSPMGILVIDEFDKITSRSNDFLEYSRVIQDSLLRIIDGANYQLTESRNPLRISTKKILVVLAGSWQSLRDVEDCPSFIGFNTEKGVNNHRKMKDIAVEDLGISREMRGRLSRIITLNDLTGESLLRILTHPTRSPWLVLERALPDTKISIDLEVNPWLAEKACGFGYGARWLQKPIIALTDRLIFEEHAESIKITKEMIMEYANNVN